MDHKERFKIIHRKWTFEEAKDVSMRIKSFELRGYWNVDKIPEFYSKFAKAYNRTPTGAIDLARKKIIEAYEEHMEI